MQFIDPSIVRITPTFVLITKFNVTLTEVERSGWLSREINDAGDQSIKLKLSIESKHNVMQ